MTQSFTFSRSSDTFNLTMEIADLCNELKRNHEPTWASVIGGAYCGGISREANKNTLEVLRRLVDLSDVPQRLNILQRTRRLMSILESLVETVVLPPVQVMVG